MSSAGEDKTTVTATSANLPEFSMAPFGIEPTFVGRIWGYNDLHPWFDMTVEGEPIGEVWLTGDECRVSTGPFAGKTLCQLFNECRASLLGPDAPSEGSPLLIKLIFAKEKLSVQVHPDDALAHKHGELRGKTECWYALTAGPDAKVALGLLPGVTMDRVKQGVRENTLEECLEMVPVHPRDLIFVDAGTVHAIWPGAALLETQQNSDLTYRLYDYGRPRQLHVEKALEATRLKTRAGKVAPTPHGDRSTLIDVEYFRVERIKVEGQRVSSSMVLGDEPAHGFCYLFAEEGSARISGAAFPSVDLPSRGIVAIPASSSEFVVEDLGGLELLRISPRWPGVAA